MRQIQGLTFPNPQDETITSTSILACHPHSNQHLISVPLRLTLGYQVIYEQGTMKPSAYTFYTLDETQFKYVLACIDGTVTPYKNGVIVSNDALTIIYSDIEATKKSGKASKGTILGTPRLISKGLGYGVTIRCYTKDNTMIDLARLMNTIPCLG